MPFSVSQPWFFHCRRACRASNGLVLMQASRTLTAAIRRWRAAGWTARPVRSAVLDHAPCIVGFIPMADRDRSGRVQNPATVVIVSDHGYLLTLLIAKPSPPRATSRGSIALPVQKGPLKTAGARIEV